MNNITTSAVKGVVFAVDFDGTCTTHEYPDVGRDIGAVPVLRRIVREGGKLILWTMRSGTHLQDAVRWFEENDLPLFGIQRNPDQDTWTDSPKCYAKIYIDDAALGCPLKPGLKGERPYVDWEEVENILWPEQPALLFREHRGCLDDSMQTVREMPTFEDLKAFIHKHYGEGVVTVKPYGWDDRIKWDTQIVCLDGRACGFMSGPFDPNAKRVHPLPASGEDELGDKVYTTDDAANTAAGSGLHDSSCSHSSLGIGVKMRLLPPTIWILEIRGDAAVLGMFSDSAGNVIWHQIPSSDLPDNLVRVENGKMIRVFSSGEDTFFGLHLSLIEREAK